VRASLLILLLTLSFFSSSGVLGSENSKLFESRLNFLSKFDVEFENKSLHFWQVGEAKRKFLFFSVYDVGYYLSGDKYDGLQHSALWIEYKRDIAVKKIHSALTDGFKENSDASRFKVIKPKLDRLLNKIDKDINAGDTLLMCRLVDDRVLFYFNKQLLLVIQGKRFSETLWSIWLGKNAVVDRVRLMNR